MKMTMAFYYPLREECAETIETDHFQKTLELVYSDPVCSLESFLFHFLPLGVISPSYWNAQLCEAVGKSSFAHPLLLLARQSVRPEQGQARAVSRLRERNVTDHVWVSLSSLNLFPFSETPHAAR